MDVFIDAVIKHRQILETLSNDMFFIKEKKREVNDKLLSGIKLKFPAKGTEPIPWNANQKKDRNCQTQLTEPPTACV